MADKQLKTLDFGGEDTYFPLPLVTAEDNDKILMVVDGDWTASDIPVQSGAYIWQKYYMSSTVTETAEEGRYYLEKINSIVPSAEIEYSNAEPIYDADKGTWVMPNSTIGTVGGSGSNTPGIENATYFRLTNEPNVWYLITDYTSSYNEIADGYNIYLTYSTKYEAPLEDYEYVTDSYSDKYPDGGWQDGYYYEVFEPITVTIDGVEVGEDILLTKTGGYFYVSKLPYNFYEGAAVVLDENIHIFGSNAGEAHHAKHYMWDGTAWTEVSTLPYEAITPAAVVLNGEIHIMGGTDSTANASKSHYKWTGTEWVSVSTLPSSFRYIKALVLDGNIHIFGGSSSSTKYHYMWDGTAWTEVSTLPYGSITTASVFVWDGNIHIMGGSSTYRTNHYMWDDSAWVSVETLTFAHQSGDVVVSNGVLHAMSDIKLTTTGNEDTTDKHWVWDGIIWTRLEQTPYAFRAGCLVELNGSIHMLGSSTDTSNYTRHYTYTEVYRKEG